MLDRLIGLESEYAIRITGDGRRPPHDEVYDLLIEALREETRMLPGSPRGGLPRYFVENGGVFAYEALPHARAHGLIEGGTPECRGPGAVVLYQRAQESLLERACARVNQQSFRRGWSVSLLRNCRDAEGNLYGAQENYEVRFAQGWRLWAYRAGLVALTPMLLVCAALSWLTGLVMLVAALALLLALFAIMLVSSLLPGEEPRVVAWFESPESGEQIEQVVGRVGVALGEAIYGVPLWCYAALVRLFCAREVRANATAFFASRCVLGGAGTVLDDRRLALSEKGVGATDLIRTSGRPEQRALYDLGNLFKGLTGLEVLDVHRFTALFRARQRLQIGLADANRCQYAEHLKLGITALVLDMAEAGFLDDAPQLTRPVEAFRALASDATLEAQVSCTDGVDRDALDLQRWYLERASVFVEEAPAHHIEAAALVRLWREGLDALEDNPEGLVGRIDWVTKRYLLQTAGDTDDLSILKKIDLRYHELGDGYLRRMEEIGAAPTLFTDEEVATARTTPPDDTLAALRARLIRQLDDAAVPVSIDWTTAQIGPRFRRKTVHLDDPELPENVVRLADYFRDGDHAR